MKFFKKGAMDSKMVGYIFIGIVVWALFFRGGGGALQATGGTPSGATSNQPIKLQLDAGCDTSQQTTLAVSAIDKFDSSIAIGGNHLYRIDGSSNNAWLGVNDGASITTSPGTHLEFLLGNSTRTSHKITAEYTVPCKGADTFTAMVERNGTLALKVFSQDDNTLITPTATEALTVGDIVDLTAEFQNQYQRSPFADGGCAIVEYNSTAYDEVSVMIGGVKSSIGTPSWYTVDKTANTVKTYEMPSIISNKPQPFTVHVDAKDVEITPEGGEINMTFVPHEWRLNPLTNKLQLFKCSEDQAGNIVGQSPFGTDKNALNSLDINVA